MKTHFFIAIIYILFLFSAGTLSGTISKQSRIAFIFADIVNVRIEPETSADIVGRIGMNQKVTIYNQNKDWVFTRYFGEQEKGYSQDTAIIEGWISKSLLLDNPVHVETIIDSVKTASTPASRLKWAKRLVIAFPDSAIHWKLLLGIATETGDSANIIRARNHLNGKEDIYIAECKCNGAKLLGKIDSTGHFTSYVWDNVSRYDTTHNSSRYNAMTPGLDRFLLNTLSAFDWGPYSTSFAAGKMDSAQSLGSDIIWLSFGPCPKDTIVTTQKRTKGQRKLSGPILANLSGFQSTLGDTLLDSILKSQITNSPKDNQTYAENVYKEFKAAKALAKTQTIQITPYPDMFFFEVKALVPALYPREGNPYLEESVGLFDETGKKLYPPFIAEPYTDMLCGNGLQETKPLQFFTFPLRDDGRIYTIYKYTEMQGSGGDCNLDLLCFKDGAKMNHFTIEHFYEGD
jgi:hypothetical protein